MRSQKSEKAAHASANSDLPKREPASQLLDQKSTPAAPKNKASRRSDGDQPIACFKKNGRQTFRVALRTDAAGPKIVVSLFDMDPTSCIERHLNGVAIRPELVPQLIAALHVAELAAKLGAQS